MRNIVQSNPSDADMEKLKAGQQATWSSGDYGMIGVTLQIVGETLCEAIDLRGGERVIDIAAGNGNASLAAARRFAVVTSTDYVPSLLEQGRRRAKAEGLDLAFAEADAEALDFADGSFDVALSTFGIMFTADHEKAAREIQRVVRSGGRIGMANWTPESFIGRLLKTIGAIAPPSPVAKPPVLWGNSGWLRERFGDQAAKLSMKRRFFVFRYRSPQHWLELFRTWYGPMLKAFATLEENEAAELEADILALIAQHNRTNGGTMVVPSEYLEVVILKS
ncbi:class I SAM-dependent methyltransferase [Paracoccus methylarcula]|uniref:Class I SAM-dependent methyltransferase n=1 Tax=Paracoccus methylarcula TaxID=72022 RepID=A0A3R7LP20_9RHOB|nr:class I SAM-dependent methyltransferase [Paracoccus methylarcula]RNF33911.1 class I SAM-dependent methyltransferase [Paracoccus methylarcula]